MSVRLWAANSPASFPSKSDLIVPVPDSSIPAALGYAAELGTPYGQAIIKNRYSDRTFIKPDQRLRQLEVDLKFNLVQPKIKGARLVIVDYFNRTRQTM